MIPNFFFLYLFSVYLDCKFVIVLENILIFFLSILLFFEDENSIIVYLIWYGKVFFNECLVFLL